jgi:hypothetical protein
VCAVFVLLFVLRTQAQGQVAFDELTQFEVICIQIFFKKKKKLILTHFF